MKSQALVLLCGDTRIEEKKKGLPAGFLKKLRGDVAARFSRHDAVELVIASDRSSAFELGTGNERESSVPETFAEKIRRSVEYCTRRGATSVVVLAGDVAGITCEIIDSAFAQLDSHEARAVLGPSRDGGLYLIGLNQPTINQNIAWHDVQWFRVTTGASVRSVLERAVCTISVLSRHDDIDSRADALRTARALRGVFRRLGEILIAQLSAPFWFASRPVLADTRCLRAGVRQLRPPPR